MRIRHPRATRRKAIQEAAFAAAARAINFLMHFAAGNVICFCAISVYGCD